jgi:hypothetical protein
VSKAEVLQLLASLGVGALPVVFAAWRVFSVISGLRAQIASLENRLVSQEQAQRYQDEKQNIQVEVLREHHNSMAVKVKAAIVGHDRRLKSMEQFLAKQFSFAPRE